MSLFLKKFQITEQCLRLAGVDIEEKIRLVLTAIEKHSEELRSAFSVLSKNKLRIRKMS